MNFNLIAENLKKLEKIQNVNSDEDILKFKKVLFEFFQDEITEFKEFVADSFESENEDYLKKVKEIFFQKIEDCEIDFEKIALPRNKGQMKKIFAQWSNHESLSEGEYYDMESQSSEDLGGSTSDSESINGDDFFLSDEESEIEGLRNFIAQKVFRNKEGKNL